MVRPDSATANSVGAALYPQDGGDAAALLTAADAAMYADKSGNRS
jgi:GGDEF domain-containing protein